MLLHAYRHSLGDFDWFAKVDPDAIFVGANFRRLVQAKMPEPDQPFYVGHLLRHRPLPLNGGCSYAFSRGGLRLLGPALEQAPRFHPLSERRRHQPTREGCDAAYDHAEEGRLAACVSNAGVPLGDSRDATGREHYGLFRWTDHWRNMPWKANDWYWTGKDPANQLTNSLADFPIVECLHAIPRDEVVEHYQRVFLTVDPPQLDLRSLVKLAHPGEAL